MGFCLCGFSRPLPMDLLSALSPLSLHSTLLSLLKRGKVKDGVGFFWQAEVLVWFLLIRHLSLPALSINMQMNQSGMQIHAKNLISPYHPLPNGISVHYPEIPFQTFFSATDFLAFVRLF